MTESLTTIQDNAANLHLCFELDEKTYAINSESVMEVTMLPSLISPQKLPQNIVGILNYNSILINVIDVRSVLNLPQRTYQTGNQVIIIKGEESLVAIIVDKVSNFINVSQYNTQSTVLDLADNFIKSFYHIDDNIINILNIASFENSVKESKSTPGTVNYPQLFPQDDESKALLEKRNHNIALKVNFNIDTDFYGKDRYITFEINGHIYCISSAYVKELAAIKNYTITKIPYATDFIKGIINLKGDFYTVISLKEFIGFKNLNEKPEEKIIVIESKDLKLAFLVDDIIDVMNVSKEQIQNKNDLKLDDLFINAEIYADNKVYNMLNIEKLIEDKKLYIE